MTSTSCLQTPNTPRIDISRASSSSHHEEDSRDSTPERELFEPQCSRLGLAFKEDGAMDLRSSTEELDFQDPNDPKPHRISDKQSDTTHETQSVGPHTRKDSQGSELGFLSVSGRTSRLSSIGSQGSRASNQSHLSGLSRSPSPHKMLLETSFCGTKGSEGSANQTSGSSALDPALEQALLSRKQDPTEAVLAEGISIEMRKKFQPLGNSPIPIIRKIPIVVEPQVVVTEVDHPMSPGKTIVADSGVEYTFIPLKGPLSGGKPSANAVRKAPVVPARRNPPGLQKLPSTAPITSPTTPRPTPAPKPSPSGTEYIRIKLKPDHMYTDTQSGVTNTQVTTRSSISSPEVHKPITLNLNNGTSKVQAPSGSPKLPRLRDTVHSRTPSPSVSRKSSFTSLFRSKEAIISSPESPGDRTRSKSKEREHKSSVFGIFKPKKSCLKKQTSPEVVHVTSPLPSLEFTFNSKPQVERLKYYETPLEGDSIRIPLHSPGTEPETVTISPPSPPKEIPPPPVNPRHSSTSSETIVFTTNLGSNNEIFTTKLPKEKAIRITENHCEKPVERKQSIELEKEKTPPEESEEIVSKPEEKLPNREQSRSEEESREDKIPITRSESSESERDLSAREPIVDNDRMDGKVEDEHELKTLVFQQDSFEDDDLPYIPTTLPLERSVAVPIVPVKQRGEIKMCPIDRPRSTTPINPNCLDDYCEDGVTTAEPKLRISLPKEDLLQGKGKSPRKWADFAEMDMGGSSSPPPPPLPPRGAPKDWINFEEVPERRKPPKRIQIIPSSSNRTTTAEENVIYSYVNPEDCKCECHELAPRGTPLESDRPTQTPIDAFPNQKLPS